MPESIAEVGRYVSDGWTQFRDIAVSGAYAYVLDDLMEVSVVSISNPLSPQLVAIIDTVDGVFDLAVQANVLYLVNYAGLWTLDVSDSTQPIILDVLERENLHELVVTNNSAYALTNRWQSPDELFIFDGSSPDSIIELGNLLFQAPAVNLVVSGTTAYVLSSGSGVCQLHTVDVSNPAEPVELIGPCESAGCRSLAVYDSVALIGGRGSDNDLTIYSISDPADPVHLAVLNSPHRILDAAIQGSYAYLATGEDGLRVIDVSDHSHPAEIGFYDTPGDAKAVAVAGDYAYVADDSSGLRIINISNPTTPVEADRETCAMLSFHHQQLPSQY